MKKSSNVKNIKKAKDILRLNYNISLLISFIIYSFYSVLKPLVAAADLSFLNLQGMKESTEFFLQECNLELGIFCLFLIFLLFRVCVAHFLEEVLMNYE